MLNMSRPVVNYFGVGHPYRDHGNSGLSRDQRIEWKQARREAQRELKSLGFKGALDTTSREKAEAYAEEWNKKFKSDPILGPLEVYQYSYL